MAHRKYLFFSLCKCHKIIIIIFIFWIKFIIIFFSLKKHSSITIKYLGASL